MRADIVASALFPDHELTDHTGKHCVRYGQDASGDRAMRGGAALGWAK